MPDIPLALEHLLHNNFHPRHVFDIGTHAGGVASTFLKLDVQGDEFEVLNGAKATLPGVEAILTEVNFIDIHRGAHLLDDLIVFLRDQNFLAYDICGDSALWQADFVFVPSTSRLRADKRWQS